MSIKGSATPMSMKAVATPMSIEVFGERGILQSKRGPAPPTVEAFGELGVLQAKPGPPLASVLLREFIENHDDARLLPSGKVIALATFPTHPPRAEVCVWPGEVSASACLG